MFRWLSGHMRGWDWDKIDELIASFARPYQQYVCATSIAASLFYAVVNKADGVVIGALAAACGGLAGGSAYLRTVDKKTEATKEIAKNRPSPETSVSAEIK